MAWRPTRYLIAGELDNTIAGQVTGWMQFAGLPEKVTFNLRGDFHRDIRGAKIRFKGDYDLMDKAQAAGYMAALALSQTGVVGDMTAGLAPQDYVSYCYLEWYGEINGRVVIELDPDKVEVIGRPLPPDTSRPIDRHEQQQHMGRYLGQMAQDFGRHLSQSE